MPDMLVHLLELPPLGPTLESLKEAGIVIRPARPYEISLIADFVVHNFSQGWADEISVGYANKPISVQLALKNGEIIGFGAYECTRRGFFGPTGVSEAHRGIGAGKALLLSCLWAMREMGYAYGIIGGAGPVGFYAKAVGAVEIPRSVPGIYADPIARLVSNEQTQRSET